MPPAQPALVREPDTSADTDNLYAATRAVIAATDPGTGNSPHVVPLRPVPKEPRPIRRDAFQPRVPVITGEAQYRGMMAVSGVIAGQLGAGANTLTIKERPRNGAESAVPELEGELIFKDMLRINGHVAGTVSSLKGTLIVDTSARVDANIDVAVCVISGTVNGDVVARERVELGPAAMINGNIATSTITMKPGAVFHGDCRMLPKADS